MHLVLARTPGAPEGAKGLSLFVAPKYLVNADGSLGDRNGVETVAIEHKLGIRASDTAAFVLEDCRVPAQDLLGDPEIKIEGGFGGAM